MDDAEKNYVEHMEIFNNYKENDKLEICDLLHMYPGDICYPNGFFDSRFFNLWIFNTKTMEKRLIEHRDGLRFYGMTIDISRIFIDGSTLLRFTNFGKLLIGQDVSITGV